jgi:hypothetical protein
MVTFDEYLKILQEKAIENKITYQIMEKKMEGNKRKKV